MTKLFPVFLLLKNKNALVYGRDNHSISRVYQLIEAGAIVSLVYPDLSGLILPDNIYTYEGNLEEAHIVESDIIFFDQSLTADEFDWVSKHKKLFHQLDELEKTDFYLGSIVDYGPIRIAISSNGRFPWLPRFLRELLSRVFSHEGELFLVKIAELRERIKHFFPDPDKRSFQIKRLITHLDTVFRLEPVKGKE